MQRKYKQNIFTKTKLFHGVLNWELWGKFKNLGWGITEK